MKLTLEQKLAALELFRKYYGILADPEEGTEFDECAEEIIQETIDKDVKKE